MTRFLGYLANPFLFVKISSCLTRHSQNWFIMKQLKLTIDEINVKNDISIEIILKGMSLRSY